MKIGSTAIDLPRTDSGNRGSVPLVDFGNNRSTKPEPRAVVPQVNTNFNTVFSPNVCFANAQTGHIQMFGAEVCGANYGFYSMDLGSVYLCAAKVTALSVCSWKACAGADIQIGTACAGNACAGANVGVAGACGGKVCLGANLNTGPDTGPCLGVNLPICPVI
jgi:hypothetical protein